MAVEEVVMRSFAYPGVYSFADVARAVESDGYGDAVRVEDACIVR